MLRQDLARQDGFVLVTALILMVVATILAMTAMGTNTLEEKMSGYMRDRQVAMQAAEAALRDGERDVQKQLVGISEADFISGCNTSATTIPSGRDHKGLCAVEIDGSPIWLDLESTTALANDAHLERGAWVTGNDAASTGRSVRYGRCSKRRTSRRKSLNEKSAEPSRESWPIWASLPRRIWRRFQQR